MVEVTIDSIRVSTESELCLVILKDIDRERYLPMWVGPYEAEAIRIGITRVATKRPLTHDLLNGLVTGLGADLSHVLVNDLYDDTYYARIIVDYGGKSIDIDARPSDAMALAVRAGVPVFVCEEVMAKAAIIPDGAKTNINRDARNRQPPQELTAFRDFINSLEFD
jgi:bifunctional DNase/RNase